jgi:hypothetical protein
MVLAEMEKIVIHAMSEYHLLFIHFTSLQLWRHHDHDALTLNYRGCKIFTKREIELLPCMVGANETDIPWEEGEMVRWVNQAEGYSYYSGGPATQFLDAILIFNCENMPEVCVSTIGFIARFRSFPSVSDCFGLVYPQNNMCYGIFCE